MFFWNKEENKIDVDLSYLIDQEMKSQIWATKNIKNLDKKNEKINLNKEYFLNRLFVNLTRGIKGCFVLIEDPVLRDIISKKVR